MRSSPSVLQEPAAWPQRAAQGVAGPPQRGKHGGKLQASARGGGRGRTQDGGRRVAAQHGALHGEHGDEVPPRGGRRGRQHLRRAARQRTPHRAALRRVLRAPLLERLRAPRGAPRAHPGGPAPLGMPCGGAASKVLRSIRAPGLTLACAVRTIRATKPGSFAGEEGSAVASAAASGNGASCALLQVFAPGTG